MFLARRVFPRARVHIRSFAAPANAQQAPQLTLEQKFSIKGTFLEGRSMYMDAQATTPLDPRVLDAMMPYLTEQFGNPHSRTHHFGWETEKRCRKGKDTDW